MGRNFRKNRLVGFIDCGDAFWEHLEDGEFRLCQCAGCERWMWETQYGGMDIRCGDCGSWDQNWVEVEPVLTSESPVYTTVAFSRPTVNVPLT